MFAGGPDKDKAPEPLRLSQKEIFRRVAVMFKPHIGVILVTLFWVTVGVVSGILPPLWTQIIIDDGIGKADLGVTAFWSVAAILMTLVGAGATLGYGYYSVVMGQRIMLKLRADLFQHLQRMPLKFFTRTRTGDIQTRLISDIQGVQTVLGSTLVDLISNIGIIISCLIAMFIMDWRLTLLSLAMVPLMMVFGQYIGNFSQKVTKGAQQKTGDLNSMMQETLSVSGILLTKTTGRLDILEGRFDEENKALAGWQIKLQLIQYLFFGLIRIITAVAPALVFLLAGWLMSQGDTTITAGKLVAFTGLQTRLFFPITATIGTWVQVVSSYALFDRLFEYLDMDPEIGDRPNARRMPVDQVKGAVAMKGVNFRYDDETEEWTLADLNFEAAPGQLVALVGPSGAGKTSLTYLIPRLYDAMDGQVTIDGEDVRDIELASLQRIVGAVTQETYLLHATVAENLRIARPEATDEELEQACRLAAIHDHIASLEKGYGTMVGERGYKLSGGEKQRLAIARAILKNPKILILDEATSALDTASERLIQGSLNSLMEGRTTFAIAHRLSTILDADLILVMQDGRIVERGGHAELLAQNGLYARLYNEQFRSQESAAGESSALAAE